MSPTACSDKTRRLNIARRLGSAMTSNTDSMFLIYSDRHIRVKAYTTQPTSGCAKPLSVGIVQPDVLAQRFFFFLLAQRAFAAFLASSFLSSELSAAMRFLPPLPPAALPP